MKLNDENYDNENSVTPFKITMYSDPFNIQTVDGFSEVNTKAFDRELTDDQTELAYCCYTILVYKGLNLCSA